ncbi:sigma-E factor negative regulatory protein [Thalassotalea hakodatensis]|uniref:sigma-E factor negative regulatory protein n=1 Tax=Thalassotalea hakodatensis TaxID=3030492 RepID=UPI0025730DAA|nr:RseA family anti-sigma factor [Thalassotalea hakodatensis]
MSESKFETVSSLVDNFHHEDAVLDDVLKDNDMSETWQRYHLIGDVLRDDVAQSIDIDLSDAISNAIAEEPTVLAPLKKPSLPSVVKAKVVSMVKPFGQVAIAASAAGLMVFGVQTNVADKDTATPYQVVQTGLAVGGVAQPVSLNFQQNTRADQQQAIVEQQRRFHALLQDHKQQMKFSAVIPSSKDKQQPQEADKSVK